METVIVHTCPYCELRFGYHVEVVDHILHDHKDHLEMMAFQVYELPHG